MPIIANNTNLQEIAEKFNVLEENLDFFFILVMGILTNVIQMGIGILVAGGVNAKNSTNVMFKNIMDYLIGAVTWWLVGYTLAYGDGNPFIGVYQFQGGKDISARKKYSHFFLQISFASTPAAIIAGAIVDRISYVGYIVYSVLITGVVYPVVCHWAWHPEGWLAVYGFKDLAGSAVVHMFGGACALVGAVILGPRINRFPKPGTEHTQTEKLRFSYHNIPMTAVGCVILTVGWFAFNGGSFLHITGKDDGETVSKIMINTWLCNSGATFGSLLIFRTGIVDGKPRWSVLNAINAGISGMAASCAHADKMDMWAAFVNGLIVAVFYAFLKKITEKLKIDDPLDVIAVHFGGGFWGTVGCTLLRQDSLVGGYVPEAGWYIAKNLAGALSIIAWSWGCCIIIFGTMRLAGVLRSSPEDELLGADVAKHKEPAYIPMPCYFEYLNKKHDCSFEDIERYAQQTMIVPEGFGKILPFKTRFNVSQVETDLEPQENVSHNRQVSASEL